uniref:Uncharacterized protein n=1 Tax=uncultured marine virus TaxID=186617 RepID=A0A0F7LBU2_9VIRU|nr:hypothetical protein [uncultured marine virus]
MLLWLAEVMLVHKLLLMVYLTMSQKWHLTLVFQDLEEVLMTSTKLTGNT